jgi:hypothetical protein
MQLRIPAKIPPANGNRRNRQTLHNQEQNKKKNRLKAKTPKMIRQLLLLLHKRSKKINKRSKEKQMRRRIQISLPEAAHHIFIP